MKNEIRIVGIDDGYFNRDKDKEALIVGVIMRGYKQIDGVLSTKIGIDSDDATDKITNMILKTSHYKQLRIIMTNGITFGGFNFIDPFSLYEKTKLPVIILIRKKPDLNKFIKASEHSKNKNKILEIINKLGEPKSVITKYGKTFYQNVGIDDKEVKNIIKKTAVNSRIPEPVRVAHLIAMGVTLGYSKGKP